MNEEIGSTVAGLMNEDNGSTVAGLMNEETCSVQIPLRRGALDTKLCE